MTAGSGSPVSSAPRVALPAGGAAHRDDATGDRSTRLPGDARLVVEDVSVRFGGVRALDRVGLCVRPGEVVSLVGPNGAGKTTLFNVISGFRRPDAGRVSLDGEDVTDLGPVRRAGLGMVRSFQRMELFEELSVLDNILVSRELRGPLRLWRGVLERTPPTAAALADAEEILGCLGLLPAAEAAVGALSTGMRRLVELGRILMSEAEIVLLDEPSSGLDRNETARFVEIVADFVARHPRRAVLLVEHDMSVAMTLARYIYVLDFGRLIAEGPPESVTRDERVRAAYLGKAW